MSNITLHMVSSVDGFIAKTDGDIAWMHSKDHYPEGKVLTQDYIEKFLESIDCYIMGSKTFEHTLKFGWPYGEKPVFVLTSRPLESEKKTVRFYSGDLRSLVKSKLQSEYKNVWVVGGSKLAKSFLKANLIDDIVITYVPILLGEGVLFFDYIKSEKELHLKDVTAFNDGMVELTYAIKK